MSEDESDIHVLNSLTDPRMGGPQRRALSVARRLRTRGIETSFLIPNGDDTFAEAATTDGFETHRVTLSRLRTPTKLRGNVRFVGDFFPTVRRISDLIREYPIDAVHANMVVNFQTALAAVRSDTPLAWHFNDTLTPTPVKQIAAQAGGRWADELIVAADAVHDYYFSSSTNTRTIYAPVDLDEFDPAKRTIDDSRLRKDLGLAPDVPIVGTVGNINPIKGHKHLLHAIERVIRDGQEIAVPIVGAKLDSRKRYFEQLQQCRKELGLEKQVKFVGFRSDIPELLSLFDLFVLPSVAEACPIVVLEAMAMKCPVVATAVGGVPEEIPNEDYGWLVPPEDAETLASAIKSALGSPTERRRRAENARERVEEEFSLTTCVDRHEELYRSMTNSNRSATQ